MTGPTPIRETSTPFRGFYEEQIGKSLGNPAESGWTSINCILPTHPGTDREKKAGVHYRNGYYNCFKDECRESYLQSVKKTKGQFLTPVEFLQVFRGFPPIKANQLFDQFRTNRLDEADFAHDDQGFTKDWGLLDDDQKDTYYIGVKEISEDHDVVQEYLRTRGLKWETLVEFGAGYIEDHFGVEGVMLPYFVGRDLVAVRVRPIAGVRKRLFKNSHQTLFNLRKLEDSTSRTVIIVEGESDCMRMQQALNDAGLGAIPVVGTPGADFKDEWLRFFTRQNRVIAIPQADYASRSNFLGHIKRAFQGQTILEVAYIPWDINTPYGKDVCDFLSLAEGNEQVLLDQIGLNLQDIETIPYCLNEEEFLTWKDREFPWLVKDLFIKGSKVFIFGEPKVKKTWLALNMAHAFATQIPVLGRSDWLPSQSCKVAFIEEEGSPVELSLRWWNITQKNTGNLSMIMSQGVKLDDEREFTKLKQTLIRLRPDIIFFDPLASLHQGDENESITAQLVMSRISTLIRAMPDVTVFIIHHTTKGGGDTLRGSGAWWGAADGQILVKEDEHGTTQLTIRGRYMKATMSANFIFEHPHFLPQLITVKVKGKQTGDPKNMSVEQKMNFVAETIFKKPECTIEEIREATGFSDNYARAIVSDLEASGRIESVPGPRGKKLYRVPEYTDLATPKVNS